MESTLAPTETSSLHDSLLAHLRSLKGGSAFRLENLHRIGGGSSRENWPFDLVEGTVPNEKRHELLLRRDPPESVVESDRTTEFELLRALQATTIPSPEVLSLDASGEVFGRPSMIMVRNRGTASRHLLRDRDPFELGLEQRVTLGKAFGRLLADLHSVDLATHGIDKILTPPSRNPAELELETWVAELDRQEIDPEPQLRLVASWLEENIPAVPEHTALVHGDFRPANVLIKEGNIEALLDWELARLGDPLDDLGWYTTPLYRQEHFIPGAWEVDDFIHEYEQATGLMIDPKALKFWQIMAMFRLSIIALTSVRSFLKGQSDRPTAPIVSLTAQTLAAAIRSQDASGNK